MTARESLHAETNALMQYLGSVASADVDGDELHRRSMLLNKKHQFLMRLLEQFTTQGKTIQRLHDNFEGAAAELSTTAMWTDSDGIDTLLVGATDADEKRWRCGDVTDGSRSVLVCDNMAPLYSAADALPQCSNSSADSRNANEVVRDSVDDVDCRAPCTRSSSGGTVSAATAVCWSSPGWSPLSSACSVSQPAAKKRRLPPPSPSVLSQSTDSPPGSPLFSQPSSSHTRASPRCLVSVLQHQQRYPPQPSTLPPPPPPPRSNSCLLASGFSTTTSASSHWPTAGDVSSSQCSQRSTTKTGVQKPPFSLRQLIADDIIQPGHNVLSVEHPVRSIPFPVVSFHYFYVMCANGFSFAAVNNSLWNCSCLFRVCLVLLYLISAAFFLFLSLFVASLQHNRDDIDSVWLFVFSERVVYAWNDSNLLSCGTLHHSCHRQARVLSCRQLVSDYVFCFCVLFISCVLLLQYACWHHCCLIAYAFTTLILLLQTGWSQFHRAGTVAMQLQCDYSQCMVALTVWPTTPAVANYIM